MSQRDTVLPFWMFELDAEQKVLRDIQIENSAYANWAKEAHDKRVADVADLRNLFLESDYDWQATKEKNQNTEQNESRAWYDVPRKELFPWTHGAKPHEHSHVEEEVHDRLKGIMLCLLAKPITRIMSAKGCRLDMRLRKALTPR